MESEQLELDKPAKAPRVWWSSDAVMELLRKRYCSPEWALMEEVAPATGGGTRYADAVAVNLWQSRGHAVHGFEVKVSRSDWLRELKQPEKAEPIFRYCDHWWIVAPRDVVKDGELPPTWGLFDVRDSGIVVKVQAPKLEAQPITRAFFASLMRRGHEQINAIAERMQRKTIDEARAQIQQRVDTEVEMRTRRVAVLEKQVAEFSAKTGIDFDNYSGPPVATMKLAQRLHALQGFNSDGDGTLTHLVELAAQLDRAAETVRAALAAV